MNELKIYQGDKLISGGVGGLPIGFAFQWPSLTPPPGSLPINGAELGRATYPELWAFAEASGNIIPEADWQTQAMTQSSVGHFSYGDGATTFRLMKVKDFAYDHKGAKTAPVMGNGKTLGLTDGNIFSGLMSGTTYPLSSYTGNYGQNVGVGNSGGILQTNRSVGVTPDPINSGLIANLDLATGEPQTWPWYIKAFDADVNPGLVNTTELAADVARLAGELNDTQGIESCFLYPNGGTATAPANVAINSRYVMDSPWPGYMVKCEAQVLRNGMWGFPGWYTAGNEIRALFVSANLLLPDNTIIIQTGIGAVTGFSPYDGNPFNLHTNLTTIPCRVYCEKGGPLPL